MAGNVLEFTDDNFKSEVLGFVDARPGRLLGPLVRPLPHAWPRPSRSSPTTSPARSRSARWTPTRTSTPRRPADLGRSRPSSSSRAARKSTGSSASSAEAKYKAALERLGVATASDRIAESPRPMKVKICGVTHGGRRARRRRGRGRLDRPELPPRFAAIRLDDGRGDRRVPSPPACEPVGLFVDRPPAEVAGLPRRVGLRDRPAARRRAALGPRRTGRAFRVVRAFRLGDVAAIAAHAGLSRPRRGPGPPALRGARRCLRRRASPAAPGNRSPPTCSTCRPPMPRLILAGGLTPENVAGRIVRVRPWMVDVAGGVESSPGVKDRGACRRVRAGNASRPMRVSSPLEAGESDAQGRSPFRNQAPLAEADDVPRMAKASGSSEGGCARRT